MLIRNFSKENIKTDCNDINTMRAVASEKKLTNASIAPANQYTRVGNYKFREQDLLGKGFSSRVYKAVHAKNESQKYAIKVINLKKFHASNLAMLENQIEVHKDLDHPNILQFYEAYKTEGFYYIVTEYCPHGDLLQFLNQKKKLDEDLAEKIIKQIVQGYKYLSRKNILHRDLKPANIMRKGDTWKIGDFGFSIFCKQESMFDKVNVGTPLYMPPEALKANKYSAKSDIFAIGVILYEILNGNTPWPCKTEKQLIIKLKTVGLKHPQGLKKQYLAKFIDKACQTNEYERMSRSYFEEQNLFQTENNEKTDQVSSACANKRVYLKDVKEGKVELKSMALKKQSSVGSKTTKEEVEVSTEISETQEKNKEPSETYKSNNTRYLLNQLQFCRLNYYMIKNISYFSLEESTKDFVCLALFKYLLKCIKQLEDPQQFHGSKLHSWDRYKTQKEYKNLQTQITNYAKRYEKQYLNTLKKAQISVIRAVNRKFPELSYTSAFTSKFYQQLYHYFAQTLRICNHETMKTFLRQEKKDENSGKNLSGAYQSVETMHTLCKILHQKHENLALNSSSATKTSSLMNRQIVLDYSTSTMSIQDYKILRKRIKNI